MNLKSVAVINYTTSFKINILIFLIEHTVLNELITPKKFAKID